MTRLFPSTPSYHLFYDLGASSLRTTLVSLRSSLLPDPLSLSAKPILQNVTELTVHGLAYDLEAGGYYFDQILRDILQADFKKNGGKGLDERGMAKLLKEARRVKHVLSANVASVARVSSIFELDFIVLMMIDD